MSTELKRLDFFSPSVDETGRIIKNEQFSTQYFSENVDEISIDMLSIPSGTFLMGSPEDEVGRSAFEGPQHNVEVSEFFISRFAVTQSQFQAVMGNNPSQIKGPNNPVECVNWFEAKTFCRRLSDLSGREYRLPTENEWEYSCRAGTSTPFPYGETITEDLANFYAYIPYGKASVGSHRSGTTPVGSFPANKFGLHDMCGNTFEWCEDILQENYQQSQRVVSRSRKEELPDYYVLRGASWVNFPVLCRSAFRFGNIPIYRSVAIGFRIVCA